MSTATGSASDMTACPCGKPGRPYRDGTLCVEHAPPPQPLPDPARTAAGLRTRQVTGFKPVPYGTATTDPLGRTVPPDPKAGMCPRYPCESCIQARPKHRGHDKGSNPTPCST